jgi:hypothetical protein
MILDHLIMSLGMALPRGDTTQSSTHDTLLDVQKFYLSKFVGANMKLSPPF